MIMIIIQFLSIYSKFILFDILTLGAVYVFKKSYNGHWSEQMKLLAADGQSNDNFGIRVNMYGTQSFISASYKDLNGTNSGSVYSFTIPSSPTLTPTISSMPTLSPTFQPTYPTVSPTFRPSSPPTIQPTYRPSSPTQLPTYTPTKSPTLIPTFTPTNSPTPTSAIQGNNDDNSSNQAASIVFLVFLSLFGIVFLIGVLCCFCKKKSERENIIQVEMSDVSAIHPDEAAQHIVASAILLSTNNNGNGNNIVATNNNNDNGNTIASNNNNNNNNNSHNDYYHGVFVHPNIVTENGNHETSDLPVALVISNQDVY